MKIVFTLLKPPARAWRTSGFAKIAVVIAFAASLTCSTATSPPTSTLLDALKICDTAVIGVIAAIQDNTATVRVTESVFGPPVAGTISVSPVSLAYCRQQHIEVGANDEVMFWLSSTPASRAYVAADRSGLMKVSPETRSSLIEATKTLAEISRSKEPDALNRAVLALARSPNPIIQREALRQVFVKVALAPNRKDYADELIALSDSEDKPARLAGLHSLAYLRVPQAIPRLIQATRSDDHEVAAAASAALANYNTPETAAALIALVRSTDPELRIRGAIDLGNSHSRQPEAKAALVALLDDPDARVREHAPGPFVGWLRDRQGDEVVPRLIRMLQDPELKVQTAAATTLGESKKGAIVEPLLEVLARPKLDRTLELRALQSLGLACDNTGNGAVQIIDQHLSLVVAALERSDSWLTAITVIGVLEKSRSPKAYEALEKAAKSHPNEETRAEARRIVARMKSGK